MRADDVAGDEMALAVRNAVMGVGVDQAFSVVEGLEPAEVAALTDCGNDEIRLDFELGAFLGHRSVVHHLALGELESPGAAVTVQQHLERHDAVADGDAFPERIGHLVLSRGHTLFRKQRGQRDLGTGSRRSQGRVVGNEAVHHLLWTLPGVDLLDFPQPSGNRDHVDRRIATADTDHFFRGHLQAAGVERAQQLHAAHAVGGIAARHGQRTAVLAANGPEDGVVVLLQLLNAHIAPDPRAESGLDVAHVENALNLVIEERPRSSVAGDPVAQHAAEGFVLVKNGAAVTHAPKLIGGAQAGGTATHDGNSLAALRFGLIEGEAFLQGIVADVLLNGVDADVVFHFVAVAAVLTGRRTHAAHLRREGIGAGDAPEGVLLPVHSFLGFLQTARDLQPAADILAGGAAPLTGRCAMHVGRAAVRVIGVEDHFLEARPPIVTFAELAQGVIRFAIGLAPGTGQWSFSSCYCLAPSTTASPTSWCRLKI